MSEGIDYIGTGCGAIIVNEENKIFMAKRGPTARDNIGLWDFLGGAIDLKEQSKEAIIREVKEEFNLDISIISLLKVFENTLDKSHWINFTYLAKYVSGTPNIMEEGKFSQFGWFSLEEIDKLNKTIGSSRNIEEYKKQLKIDN